MGMTAAALAPRQTLGRYEIVGEIARGAMGVVYKARDPLIDRMVAIKTVDLGQSNAETEAFERRFFREAKSAGRLNHPNVVTIHDVGKSGDLAYIAMEYLDGSSLREVLDSGVELPPQRIADIVAEIAEGLAFAHGAGVVHRDVKPANVMVLASGAIKITDFGIAQLPTGTRTMTGNVFGSPRYTSPEQVMGRPVDGRSDIFSLGAVLFEMLTGQSAFNGPDLNGILKQVLTDPTPPPSTFNPKLPRAFDHIVGKALAKDPAERYQNASEMARDLRAYDKVQLATPAPAMLPALEHPTSAKARPAVAIPKILPGAFAVPAPPPLPPWWKRKVVWAASSGVVLAVAIAAVMAPGMRGGTTPNAPAVAKARTVAPLAPTAETTAVPSPAPAPDAAVQPPVTAQAPVSSAPASPAAPAADPASTPLRTAQPTTPSLAPASTAAPMAADAKPAEAPFAPPPAAPKPTARVQLAVVPWGEIVVDGKPRGLSPPTKELRLPPGRHTIEIRNGTFPAHVETVEVRADEAVRVEHKF
ncbi:MAG: serine/threonine-protein kinase [Burkholderiales bacterium]